MTPNPSLPSRHLPALRVTFDDTRNASIRSTSPNPTLNYHGNRYVTSHMPPTHIQSDRLQRHGKNKLSQFPLPFSPQEPNKSAIQ